MHPAIQDLEQRLKTDTPFWAQWCATILTKDKRRVRAKAFPWQARTPETPARVTPLDEALERQRAAGRPMRAIILKARQLGFSTWVQIKLMQRVTQMPDQYALIAAHKRRAASNLMDMAVRIYDNLPTDHELGELIYGESGRAAPFSVRPQKIGEGQTRAGNRWMALGDRQRRSEQSVYETMTAGAKGDGRASTPSMFHGSEVAHYEDPWFLSGALEALPMLPETIGVLESTANGFNDFFDMWQDAVEGRESEFGGLWVPLFYGWQDNPYNRFEFASEQARERFEKTIGDPAGGGDEEEPWLVEEFQVTLEQLYWRRLKLASPEIRGDLEKFHQENPATPEQAFIGSGRPVFPGILVAKMISAAERAPEPVEGVLRGVDFRERKTRSGTVQIPQRAVWVPAGQMTADDHDVWPLDARLLVWEHPVNASTEAVKPEGERKPDGQYVVFGDVAQGEGSERDDPDYSVAQVLDHVSRMQVARYRSRIPIHDYPLLLLLIALYYNEAWLAPEKTGLGVGVVDALAKDYRYRMLYRTHRPGDDQRTDAVGDRVGWETTPRTKPLMELAFGQVLASGEHGLRDVLTGREFTTYVQDPNNPAKHGAQPGAHDDCAMAFMGAHRVAAELRPRDQRKTRKVRGHHVEDPLTGW